VKVIIFGASGLLGKELIGQWPDDEVVGLGSRHGDIRDAAKVGDLVEEVCPQWIVVAAAYTNVDECESHPQLAFEVNRDSAVNIAEAAKRIGARLLFISSDYVFDGKKSSAYQTDDLRNPQSVYGRSKAEAEVRLLQVLPECCIVRTSWLFGTGGKCFPDTILKLAATRPVLDVVSDQRGCPTYAVDLARAIVELCRKDARGILHVTNAGDCSWFEFAREIVKRAGVQTEVRPVSTLQMARPAPRPAYSVLSPDSLHKYGISMPTWLDALSRYLQERRR